jgi:hypothetical protein
VLIAKAVRFYKKIQADGIQVVVSHDATQRIKEVLA